MKSVWLSWQGIKKSQLVVPDKCLVCRKPCKDRMMVGSIPTDMATAGIRFVLGLVRRFPMAVHLNGDCDARVKSALFKLEGMPIMFMAISSVAVLLAAVLIDVAYVFLVFAMFFVYLFISFMLERSKNWPIRITESMASGDGGAYEFEFRDDAYAAEFAEMNRDIVIDDSK